MQVNYEEVSKRLAIELADARLQVASYQNLVSQMEQELQRRDAARPTSPPHDEPGESDEAVQTV